MINWRLVIVNYFVIEAVKRGKMERPYNAFDFSGAVFDKRIKVFYLITKIEQTG